MSRAVIVIEGYLSKDPELGRTQSDVYLPLSIPHTPRKKNRDTGEWEDAGPTLWVQATVWGDNAEALAPVLRKGTFVRVEGEPVMRAWESNGKQGVNLEVKFPDVTVKPKKPRVQDARGADEPWAPIGGAFADETPF